MKKMNCLRFCLWFTAIFILIACSTNRNLNNFPEFKSYNDQKLKNTVIRLPVVFIPGFKGSVLRDKNDKIWGKSNRVSLYGRFDNLGFSIDHLAREDPEAFHAYYTQRGFKAVKILEEYSIQSDVLKLFSADVYKTIIEFLEETGGYVRGIDLHTFPYDWRLDNRISAIQLQHKIAEVQQLYRRYIDKSNMHNWEEIDDNLKTEDGKAIKVNIVAHSMGGLVARYYLQMLNGYGNTYNFITFGTPNKGSMDSLQAFKQGEYPEALLPLFPREKTREIIFSWPSVYQVLPRYKDCIKATNIDQNKLSNWGLFRLEESGFLSEEMLDIAIANWAKYGFIPEGKNETSLIMKQFLKQQLKNSTSFYRAINGKCGDNNHPEAFEEKMLKNAKIFKMPSVERCHTGNIQTNFFIFGGNCEPTITYVKIVNKNSNEFKVEFISQVDEVEESIDSFGYGDGRVPHQSLKPENNSNRKQFVFLLCSDHLELVQDPTFQYNLLTILLEPTHLENGYSF